ncbi:MAG: uracil-DNA glycosylase [Patescibacteria group bacterium]|nr:uracil-DNA glycosylase [Patescibacteria group bacterium]
MKDKKQVLLEQIKADIIEDNVCPDLAQQATNLVMGDGNVNAEIVFIGEAPGKKEDVSGLPFMGAAGKFLDEMLVGSSIKRSDVYITNIVKYRPPENRDPSIKEKEAFWPYLVRQLDVIQPIAVVTLGRHSMEYFLPNQKIGEIHGQPSQIRLGDNNIIIMPLYHPAAALYNRSLKATLVEDFNKLPKIIDFYKNEKENI